MAYTGTGRPLPDEPSATYASDIGADNKVRERERLLVSEMQRNDLEDRYFKLIEENKILKRHTRKQEDRIKKMGTKILLLTNDRKRLQALGITGSVDQNVNGATGFGSLGAGGKLADRDLASEEALADLHNRVSELESHNKQLREKLSEARQQLISQTSKRPMASAFGETQPRVDTNLLRANPPSKTTRFSATVAEPPAARYGQSVLEDVRAENAHLHDVIAKANEQIRVYELDIEALKEQKRVLQTEHDEELLRVKQSSTQDQKQAIQENIDFIRVQRDLREKTTRLSSLQTNFQGLEERLRTLAAAHEQLIKENDRLNDVVAAKDTTVLQLQSELRGIPNLKRENAMLREQLDESRRECMAVKEANENILANAFDTEKEREWRQKEQALRVQIAQLEATLKAEYGDKGVSLDRLNEERERADRLDDELKRTRVQLLSAQEQLEAVQAKMSVFNKDSAISDADLDEALVLVRQRKQLAAERADPGLDFLHRVDDEAGRDMTRALRELQVSHADTIQELEKTRNMLVIQYKINQDYQLEVQAVTKKMEENKKEFEMKLDEYARLLDLRAARIKKLEAQLKDVAYGTRQYKASAIDMPPAEGTVEVDEAVRLERGENVVELNVTRVSLTEEAVRLLGGDLQPPLFCTWDFYDFETQATPILRGIRNEYNFSSLYTVKVDDFLLQYMQREYVVLEVHLALGTDYRTLAAARLSMRELLEKPSGRVHLSSALTGTDAFPTRPTSSLPEQVSSQLGAGGDANGAGLTGVLGAVNFGMVEYWLHLKIPMDQALRLYRERTKALGYLSSNLRAENAAVEGAAQVAATGAASRTDESINNLHVKLVRCVGLQARRPGTQPSPYAIYKFFDFPDHDTVVIPSSNNPEFNDHRVYCVQMFADLDRYLKSQQMAIYVFDDMDPEEANYLGVAYVPLIPLAHDKAITGSFELRRRDSALNGAIEVNLQWQFAYVPPRAGTRIPTQPMPPGIAAAGEPTVALMPDESLPPPPPLTTGLQSRPAAPIAALPSNLALAAGGAQGPTRELTNRTAKKSAFSAAGPPQPSGQPMLTQAPQVQATAKSPSPPPTSPPPQTYSPPPPASPPAVAAAAPPTFAAAPPTPAKAAPLATSTPSVTPVKPAPTPTPTPTAAQAAQQRQPQPLLSPPQSPPPSAKMEPKPVEPRSMSDTEDIVVPQRSAASGGVGPSQSAALGGPGGAATAAGGGGPAAEESGDVVTIELHSLSLADESPVFANEEAKKLFVEYKFLNMSTEELELPFTLPKPTEPGRELPLNWKKVFSVNYDSHYQQRQFLAAMLVAKDSEDIHFIPFTLVSEPEEPDGECLELGFGRLSVRRLFAERRDAENVALALMEREDGGGRPVGQLRLSVRCVAALRAIALELPPALVAAAGLDLSPLPPASTNNLNRV